MSEPASIPAWTPAWTEAAARFIAHPQRERRIAYRARVAHDFVVHGRRQPTLLGYRGAGVG